ncbi:serine hydrolase domain-containing protein [Phenylobacterium sp.]|uniref:serine hydrolase domain-containing protein n=1 Tax=Phenylobacterium sp. TaxID=1871053 RepID=UPI002F41D248
MRRAAIASIALAVALAATAAPAAAQSLRTLDGKAFTPAGADRKVRALMQAGQVRGLAVALIRDGRVAYLRGFGARDARGDPLTPDTVMYAASLTKATFGVLVMQLVADGKVNLDRPIATYLPKPLPDYPKYADLKGDPRWRKLTLRILLDHTSGIANYRGLEPDGKLRFHRDPGRRFGYSGEGINLAQFVLEEGLKIDVAAELQRRIFDRYEMSRTGLTWRDDFADNVADSFLADGSVQPHQRRASVRAAGSMDTTPRDWSRFLAAVVRGEPTGPEGLREMIRPRVFIDSATEFPSLTEETTDENYAIRLGYGVGWGVYQSPFGHAFFKEGHDDGTQNYALCIQQRRSCILVMSNTDRAEAIFKPLVEALMGDVALPWKWEGYTPYDQPSGGTPAPR